MAARDDGASEASGAGLDERMQVELKELLDLAAVTEMAPVELQERLESIDARYLGDGAGRPEIVERRQRVVAAYTRLTRDIERHHQLEAMSQALGFEPAS